MGSPEDGGPASMGDPASCGLFLSIARCQGLGEAFAVIGEGRGVISIRGPTPGEDKTEAGDNDPAV